MGITNIIFDIDGTLMDTKAAYVTSLKHILESYTMKKYTAAQLGLQFGRPGAATLREYGIRECDLKTVLRSLFNHTMKLKDGIKPFDGVEALLEALRAKGCRLAIATSRQEFETFQDKGLSRLLRYFDSVACTRDGLPPKPDPAILACALSMLGAGPEEAIYVGDTEYDYLAACGCGMPFALAGWGEKGPMEKWTAKQELCVCKEPGALLKLL